jgi:hypothetical protein
MYSYPIPIVSSGTVGTPLYERKKNIMNQELLTNKIKLISINELLEILKISRTSA